MPTLDLTSATKGLRRSAFELESTSRGTVDLPCVQCENLKPDGRSLIPWNYGISAVPAALTTALNGAGLTTAGKGTHPFPQILRGRKTTYVFGATSMYTVNESTWALTAVTPLGVSTRTAASIPSGGIWQMADFGPVCLFTNGACVIIQFVNFTNGTASTLTLIDTSFYCNTMLNFRGRLLMGGFAGTTYKTMWTDFLAKVVDDIGQGLASPTVPSLTSDQVWWSSIGGEDMLQFFLPETVLDGADIVEDLPNSIANGTFASATGWTIAGAWTISGGKLNRTASASDLSATQVSASQTIPLVVGQTYEVTFTVSNWTAGSVQAALGTTLGTARGADGTYSQYIKCVGNTTFGLTAGATFAGSIDNVFVRALNGNLADELFLRNEQGHRAMPWRGDVLWSEKLSDGVIIFTESGVGALVPISGPYPTFAFRWLADVGSAVRGSAGGSEAGVLFIDSLGTIYLIGSDFSLTRLGWEEYGLPLVVSGDPITVHFVPSRTEWIVSGQVSDEPYAIHVSVHGACTLTVGVCALALLDGYESAVLAGTADTFTVETIDFAPAGSDPVTLQRAFVGSDATAEMTITTKYRNSRAGGFTTGSTVLANLAQASLGNVRGRDFRILVEGTLHGGTQIHQIGVSFDEVEAASTGERSRPNVPGFNA